MNNALENEEFNLTLRFLMLFFAFIFVVFNITSCELKKIDKATEISDLKKPVLGRYKVKDE